MATSHPVPFHLAHKPLIAVPYAAYDGPYAGKTDAHYLTIGSAQWAQHYGEEISAKVFRHSNQRWSRQSEELPLHRVFDLAILITATLGNGGSKRVHFPSNTFEGQSADLDLPLYGDLKLPADTEKLLRERLKSLVRTIKRLHPELIADALGESTAQA